MRFLYWSLLVLILTAFFSFEYAQETKIKIEVIDFVPYIDYTFVFDSNFSINLPDFDELIYAKALPEDVNFTLNNSTITVNENKKGFLVLKYRGTKFLEGTKTFEKTFNLELLQPTKITLIADTNVVELNPKASFEENQYVWQTNEKNFLLHIALKKDKIDLKYWIIIFVSVIIILIIYIPKIIKKYKKEEKEELFLDTTQKNILNYIKKKKVVTQKDIAKEFNIKKSHLSKILSKMERNTLIERKRVGKVNKIILAKKENI